MLFTIRPESTTQQRAATLNEWYRKQLRSKLPPLFEKWESIIGVHADEVKIKDMLTKWGTCNTTDKRIWINLQLAKKRCSVWNMSWFTNWFTLKKIHITSIL